MEVNIIRDIEAKLNGSGKESEEIEKIMSDCRDSARRLESRFSDFRDDYSRLDDKLDKYGIRIEELESVRKAIREATS